jgi:hypothetical protein
MRRLIVMLFIIANVRHSFLALKPKLDEINYGTTKRNYYTSIKKLANSWRQTDSAGRHREKGKCFNWVLRNKGEFSRQRWRRECTVMTREVRNPIWILGVCVVERTSQTFQK